MNKTLKTVLITVAVIFVLLFALVMLFGEEASAPSDIAPDAGPNSIEFDAASANAQAPISSDAEISEEEYKKALAYDVFDWNMADDGGKRAMAEAILRVWDAKGANYAIQVEELVAYIDANLYDQAIIFEVACVAAQIDPLPYYE